MPKNASVDLDPMERDLSFINSDVVEDADSPVDGADVSSSGKTQKPSKKVLGRLKRKQALLETIKAGENSGAEPSGSGYKDQS